MIHGRRSFTAERVAYSRAAHQLLDAPPRVFDDPLAVKILGRDAPQRIRAQAWRFATPAALHLRAFLVARSRLAEEALAAAQARGVRQCVLLGAGLDTGAFRNPAPLEALAVFEVDHPATQQWKRTLLASAGIAVPPALRFVAVDFERQSLGAQLQAAGLRRDAPAWFTWLGVTMYLTRQAVNDTLRYIAGLPLRSGVLFDYATPPADLPLLRRLRYASLLHAAALGGEPWRSFYRPAALAAQLLALGFAPPEDLGSEELNRRYFEGRSDRLRCAGPGRLVCARTAALRAP